MVVFNTGYYHPMDREYEGLGLSPKNIGLSANITQMPLDQLDSAVNVGASTFEIGFLGTGKGNRAQGSITPETVGKTEREVIKEVARINEVKLSTHAAVTLTGFSGFRGDRMEFSDEARQRNINEIKRAVDFAADVAEGGPVVVHLGEFPRSIYGKFGKEKFEAFPEEKDKMVHYLVDPVRGNIIQGVRADEEVYLPEMVKDPVTGEEMPKRDAEGTIIIKPRKFYDFAKEMERKGIADKDQIAMEFFRRQQDIEIEHAKGYAAEYEQRFAKGLKVKERLLRHKRFWERFKKYEPEAYADYQERMRRTPDEFMEDIDATRDPIVQIDGQLKRIDRDIAYSRDFALSQRRQATMREELVNRVKPLQDVGIDRAAEGIARIAKYAYDVEKSKDLKKPLFIAPENVFTEYYGSHPDELKEVIQKARGQLAGQLRKEGYSKEKADKVAKDHIKATFDIGHAYLWKKFFKGSDEEFENWMDKKVQNLFDEGIIGHVHFSDNFGYEDEHLTPGEGAIGRERFRNFVERMKKSGIKDLIVEWGAQAPHESWEAMAGGWDVFGSPIYGAERKLWSDVHESYFGQVNPPNFVFGEYAPSQEFRGAPFYFGQGFE